MRIIHSAVALCCTVLLAACFPPMTAHPVGGANALPDPSYVGTWNAKMAQADPGKQDAVFVFRMKGGKLTVLITDPKEKHHDDDIGAELTGAMVGGNRFLNARLVATNNHQDDSGQPPGTFPVLCKFTDARHASLYLMNDDATKAAIKAGKIKGHVEPGQFGDATITADVGALNAFMSSPAGLALFTEKIADISKK